MSWTCPYEINTYCKRLDKPCQPGIKGCALDKVVFLDLNKEYPSVNKIDTKGKHKN